MAQKQAPKLSPEEADRNLAKLMLCSCSNAAQLFNPLAAAEVRKATDQLKQHVSSTQGSSANLRFISVSLWENEKVRFGAA
jgi:hypothetical protein